MGNNALTGTTANPSTPWLGTSTTNTYFKNLASAGGSVTMVANWTPNVYTINYNLNGGTAGSNAPTSGIYDSDVQISNPTKLHYTFTGWTSTTLGNDALTGTTANPSTGWTGSETKNTYFRNLRGTGTVTMIANWIQEFVNISFNASYNESTNVFAASNFSGSIPGLDIIASDQYRYEFDYNGAGATKNITVTVPYTNNSGNARNIYCALYINGTEQSRLSVTYSRNNSPATYTFNNITIPADATVVIDFPSSTLNNSNTQVSGVNITFP